MNLKQWWKFISETYIRILIIEAIKKCIRIDWQGLGSLDITNVQCMTELVKEFIKGRNTIVDNATTNQIQGVTLIDTKGEYMKESNTLVEYATIMQVQREILLDTKGQYMKV